MKSTFLFCTRLITFISEIPLLFLLIVSFYYTDKVEGLFGLWPLIVSLIGFMVFILLFFVRFITISYEEIRMVGLFSSKDSTDIDAGKTIRIYLKKNGRIIVELWGIDKKPAFDWIDSSEVSTEETRLFREKAIGGKRSVSRALRFFGVPCDDIERLFSSEPFTGEYENIRAYSEISEEQRLIGITVLTTL